MALGTPNTQAIAIANQEINIAQQLVALAALIDHANSQFVQLTLGQTFGQMGTIKLNPDGTPGDTDGTPDAPTATPNPGNPINPGLYPSISRLISANDLASLDTLLRAVSTLLAGGPVTQQGQAPQLLAKIMGGEGDGAV